MKTKYGIPQKELDEIVKRDTKCAYCGKKMIDPWDPKNTGDSATIEHLNHIKDKNSVKIFISKGKPVAEIIVICHQRCNSSRRDKKISEWIDEDKSGYCKRNDISIKGVASVVRDYINKYEKGNEKI